MTSNEKPWARAREMSRVLGYNKKTANVVKNHCSKENYAKKYQTSSVLTAATRVNWPKDSQKFDIYINEEGMYELVFFQVNSQRQKTLEGTAAMCCFPMFDSSLQTK